MRWRSWQTLSTKKIVGKLCLTWCIKPHKISRIFCTKKWKLGKNKSIQWSFQRDFPFHKESKLSNHHQAKFAWPTDNLHRQLGTIISRLDHYICANCCHKNTYTRSKKIQQHICTLSKDAWLVNRQLSVTRQVQLWSFIRAASVSVLLSCSKTWIFTMPQCPLHDPHLNIRLVILWISSVIIGTNLHHCAFRQKDINHINTKTLKFQLHKILSGLSRFV